MKDQQPTLKPVGGDEYRIELGSLHGTPWDMGKVLADAAALEAAGDVHGACQTRYDAFRRLVALLPEDEECNLSWDDIPSRNALTLIYRSAIDHFLVGDTEMGAAMLEMALDLDPEDHLGATPMLAFCYVALGEWELLDEVIADLEEKDPVRSIVLMWSALRRTGKLPEGEPARFRHAHPAYYAEFTAAEHPADEAFLRAIEAEHPTREAQARELWLRTEHLWRQFPELTDALKAGAAAL